MQKIFLAGKYGSIIGNYAIVDDADFEELNKLNWYADGGDKKRKLLYAVRTKVTKIGTNRWKKEKQRMHKVILSCKDPKLKIDHIDHNGLNNQRFNLRTATSSENGANRRPVNKYLGVCMETRPNGTIFWRAYCGKDGVSYRAVAKTEIEAAKKYNELAKKHHGEFANLNVIIE